jgi:hypothetical protein
MLFVNCSTALQQQRSTAAQVFSIFHFAFFILHFSFCFWPPTSNPQPFFSIIPLLHYSTIPIVVVALPSF